MCVVVAIFLGSSPVVISSISLLTSERFFVDGVTVVDRRRRWGLALFGAGSRNSGSFSFFRKFSRLGVYLAKSERDKNCIQELGNIESLGQYIVGGLVSRDTARLEQSLSRRSLERYYDISICVIIRYVCSRGICGENERIMNEFVRAR